MFALQSSSFPRQTRSKGSQKGTLWNSKSREKSPEIDKRSFFVILSQNIRHYNKIFDTKHGKYCIFPCQGWYCYDIPQPFISYTVPPHKSFVILCPAALLGSVQSAPPLALLTFAVFNENNLYFLTNSRKCPL